MKPETPRLPNSHTSTIAMGSELSYLWGVYKQSTQRSGAVKVHDEEDEGDDAAPAIRLPVSSNSKRGVADELPV